MLLSVTKKSLLRPSTNGDSLFLERPVVDGTLCYQAMHKIFCFLCEIDVGAELSLACCCDVFRQYSMNLQRSEACIS
ncbi:unnamed protein product [Musa acuminata subsp. burmannicoides]